MSAPFHITHSIFDSAVAVQCDIALAVHGNCVCQRHLYFTTCGIFAGGKAGWNPAFAKLLGPQAKKQKLDSPAAASLPFNGEMQTLFVFGVLQQTIVAAYC